MVLKSSDKGQRQPVDEVVDAPVDAEELYRRFLRISAERNRSRNEADHTITELKKANREDISSYIQSE